MKRRPEPRAGRIPTGIRARASLNPKAIDARARPPGVRRPRSPAWWRHRQDGRYRGFIARGRCVNRDRTTAVSAPTASRQSELGSGTEATAATSWSQ